jgi:hypothetical protein
MRTKARVTISNRVQDTWIRFLSPSITLQIAVSPVPGEAPWIQNEFYLWDMYLRVAETDFCLFHSGFFFELVFNFEDEAKCSRRRLPFSGPQSVISQKTERFIKKIIFLWWSSGSNVMSRYSAKQTRLGAAHPELRYKLFHFNLNCL